MTTTNRHFPLLRNMKVVSAGGEDVPVWTAFPNDYADWLYVGLFKHGDAFTESNLQVMLATLRQVCGTHLCKQGVIVNHKGDILYSIVIIRDLPEVMAIAADLMETHENGEHISDEHYWKLVDFHLQKVWAGLPIPDRIDYVKRTGTPPEVVLAPYVSEELYRELWTKLYQEMDL